MLFSVRRKGCWIFRGIRLGRESGMKYHLSGR